MLKGKTRRHGRAHLKAFDGQRNRQVAPEGYPKADLPPSLGVVLGWHGDKAPAQGKAGEEATACRLDLQLQRKSCLGFTRLCNARDNLFDQQFKMASQQLESHQQLVECLERRPMSHESQASIVP